MNTDHTKSCETERWYLGGLVFKARNRLLKLLPQRLLTLLGVGLHFTQLRRERVQSLVVSVGDRRLMRDGEMR